MSMPIQSPSNDWNRTSPLAPHSSGVPSQSVAHSATEFESMLLTSWLQSAEDSFGSVPGADEDQDSSADQVKSFATQQLARAWSAAGGIGIAKGVAHALNQSSLESAPKAELGLCQDNARVIKK